MENVSRDLVGFCQGEQTFRYTWRDAALYALAVGASQQDIAYLYEKDLRILPCFALVPYWGTFGWTPERRLPQPAPMQVGLNAMRALHMAHDLILHQPLNPYGDCFHMRDTITDLFNHRGKGIVLRSTLTASTAEGQPVFTNIGDVYFRGYQAPDAAPYTRKPLSIPQNPPDLTHRLHIGKEQHLLYRLCGDTNIGHVDDALMRAQGRRGAIMQGMCTLGIALRVAITALLPNQPERVRKLGAEMRNVVYPGAEIELRLWRTAPESACFRVMNLDDQNIAIERGYLQWD